MLQVPAFSEFNGITIFADDNLFYKYYPIAAVPNICRDKNGHPVFLLSNYALSDEDRLADPSLPSGGGYLNFDIRFGVTDEELDEVRAYLQPMVNKQWSNLKNGSADDKARPGVAGTVEPPKVEFGTPTWTGGKVAMDAPQSGDLISARVCEAEPSAISGNSAVFSIDLTPAGATFMKRTLVDPDGGGIDLTPIQVVYDLKFWARLPAVQIHIKADSQKVHQYVSKMLDGRGVDHCTTYDFQHTDIAEDTVKMSGAIDVQIDTGSGSLPDQVIEELRQYSLELVKQMIQASFFTSTSPTAHPGDGEQTKSHDDSNNSKKYFKQDYDAVEMKIEIDLEQRSVVEWEIHPQATLQTFFNGMTPDEIKQYVREISLDDPFYQNLQLTVRAFTDFTDPDIANIEVQVNYSGTDEEGHPCEKDKTFTFTSSDPMKWSPSLIGSLREYRYRYRPGFKGQDPVPFTDWAPSKSPDLNIAVPNPGKIALTVLAGDVDFDTLVQQIQVAVRYEDADHGVAADEEVIKLTAACQEAHYRRTIYKPRRKPVQYRTYFRMKSGEVREDDEWRSACGQQLLINQPFVDLLRISLMPTGDGWNDIVCVSVELKYEDLANNYRVQPEPLIFKNRDEFKTWKVYLRDRNLCDFEYRIKATYKNGHFEDSGWKKETGSGSYPLKVVQQGLNIGVLPATLDFSSAPLTEVYLHYKSAGVDRQDTLTFHDKTAQIWSIDVPPGAPVEYSCQVTHYPAGSQPVVLPETTEHDTAFVIPPYRAPREGKLAVQVFATLVDFAVTPMVTVDLRYDDDANDVHLVQPLTFTDNKTQVWEVVIKDSNAKQFSYKLSYFTADGVEQPQPVRTQDVPRIVIARYKP